MRDDGLVEVVSDDVVSVLVAAEELGRAVHLLVVDPVLAVRPVLDAVLQHELVGVGAALGSEGYGLGFCKKHVGAFGGVAIELFAHVLIVSLIFKAKSEYQKSVSIL